MGLFDKIKDNAKNISIKAIEATREYDEDYLAAQQAEPEATPAPIPADTPANDDTPAAAPADADSLGTEGLTYETDEPADEPAKEPAPAPRKSRITEVPKEKVEPKTKTSSHASARSASSTQKPPVKPYRPFYKTSIEDKPEDKKSDTPGKDSEDKKPAAKPRKPISVIDITPKRTQHPLKGAIYARERAAITALASQRKLSGTVALYATNYMNFRTRVYINRIEYSGSFGKTKLPIEDVSWVKLRAGGTGVIIETTEGKRVVMVIKPQDRLAFADAVIKVQALQPKRAKFKDTQTVRIDELEKFSEGIDEIEKLAKLYDKGILSQEEFETKKKQILGI